MALDAAAARAAFAPVADRLGFSIERTAHGVLGIVTAIISGFLGSAAAWAVVTRVMEIPWQFQPAIMLVTGIGSTVITLTFGFAGTWRALSHKAAPLLRNE